MRIYNTLFDLKINSINLQLKFLYAHETLHRLRQNSITCYYFNIRAQKL